MNKILFIFLFLVSYTLYSDQTDMIRFQIDIRSKQLESILDSIDINSENFYIVEIIQDNKETGISPQEYEDIIDWIRNNKINIESGYFSLTMDYLEEIYANKIKLQRYIINEDFKFIFGESGISEDYKLYLEEKEIVDNDLLEEFYYIYLENGSTPVGKKDHLIYLGYSEEVYSPSKHFSVSINPDYNFQYLRVKTLSVFNKIQGLENLSSKSVTSIRKWSNYLCSIDIWEIIPLLLSDGEIETVIIELYNFLSGKSYSELKEFSVEYNYPIHELITLRDRLRVLLYWIDSPGFRFFREVIK